MTMIDESIDNVQAQVDDIQQKFYGVVVGTVINVVDPMALGRVQLQLPFIDDADLSPWARVATLMAGPASGSYYIPNIGDEVLVAFEHGDPNVPYVIGSLWSAMAPPPLPSPIPQIRMIRTLANNQIIISELPPTITIQNGTGNTILMSPAGIQITAGANVINMTPDGITLSGPNINVAGSVSVNITAPTVSINGAAATDVKSGGICNVAAPLVKIN